MKIVVLSDTHIPVMARELPGKVREQMKECDLVIHAGDIVDMSVIDDLARYAPVKAVCGNMDSDEVRRELPEKMVFEAAGKKIGVVHGRGPDVRILNVVREEFKRLPDIVIFGHSHVPCREKIGGTLFFNPGSACDTVFAKNRSFGVIDIDGDDIFARIIALD